MVNANFENRSIGTFLMKHLLMKQRTKESFNTLHEMITRVRLQRAGAFVFGNYNALMHFTLVTMKVNFTH